MEKGLCRSACSNAMQGPSFMQGPSLYFNLFSGRPNIPSFSTRARSVERWATNLCDGQKCRKALFFLREGFSRMHICIVDSRHLSIRGFYGPVYVLSTLATSASVGPMAPSSLSAATQDVAYTHLGGKRFTIGAASLNDEEPPKKQICVGERTAYITCGLCSQSQWPLVAGFFACR